MTARLSEIERSANLEAERRGAEAQTQARAEIDRALADSEKPRVDAEAQQRAEAERLAAGVERRVVVAQPQIRSDLEPKIAHAERQLEEMDARRRTEVEQLQLECSRHQSEVTALRRELEVILDSTIWRASAPLRMAAGKLPSSLRPMARTGLRAVYWVLTPWDTPKRLRFLRERYRQEPGKAVLETPPIDGRTDDSPPAVTVRLHPVPAASEPRRPVRSETAATPFAGTIICLSHVFPLPPRAGNEYRIHRMLVRLRQSGYRIVLVVSPRSPQAIDAARWGALAAAYGNVVYCERDGQIRYRMDECPNVLAPLEGQRTPSYAAMLDEGRPLPPAEVELLQVDRAFCPDALIATLIQLQSSLRPCAVLAEYVWMTRGLPLLDPSVLTVVDTIDVFSTYHEKVGAFGIAGWQVRPEDEAQRLARAQVLVAIQPEEARVLGNLAPGHEVVTAGVDFDVVEGRDWPAKPVVFCVGSDNPRNLLGLRDFLKFAWPEIRSAVPDVRLAVAGSIGAAVPDYLQDVDVLGHVDDLDSAYRRARVVVNPAVAGTGLKVKTVEALSRLRPIVTWPNGVDGLPPEMAELVPPAEDWLDFSERVIAWLRSETPAFNAATAASIRHLLSSDHVYAELEARLARYFDAQHSR
jgi:glycosyltransferase involved in cell wall biosynthesis